MRKDTAKLAVRQKRSHRDSRVNYAAKRKILSRLSKRFKKRGS